MSTTGGVFVAVVGPSGAGKDSLLSAARASLAGDPRFFFARRFITRAADHTEDSESVDAQTFDALRGNGAFVLSWEAHDLKYGLPAALINELAQDRVVIANVSRSVLPTIRQAFPGSCIIEITASEEILRQRLALRGRETAALQQGRLARAQTGSAPVSADITIENNGSFEDASRCFVEALKSTLPAKTGDDHVRIGA